MNKTRIILGLFIILIFLVHFFNMDDCYIFGEDIASGFSGSIWQIDSRTNIKIKSLSPYSDFPRNVATGDVDGDGKVDLLVSGDDQVYLFYNQTLLSAAPVISTDSANAIFYGKPNTNFGEWICCGDIDGDARDDILISAPYAVGGSTDAQGGEVYLFYGYMIDAGGQYDISLANITINGTDPNGKIGSDGLAICDVVETSRPDFLISASSVSTAGKIFNGELYIFDGNTADGSYGTSAAYCTVEGTEDYDQFGSIFSCENFGNTADETISIVCHAKLGDGRGRIYLLDGGFFAAAPPGRVPVDAIPNVSIEGTSPGENTGTAFSGDFDGDGLKDLVVGSSGYDIGNLTNAGRICVYSGQNLLQFTLSTIDPQSFDIEILGPGNQANCTAGFGADLDNDNIDELIASGVTADADGISRGEIYIFKRNNLFLDFSRPAYEADITIQGNMDMMRLSCMAAENINNNQGKDLIILQRKISETPDTPGAVYIIFDPIIGTSGLFIKGRIIDSYSVDMVEGTADGTNFTETKGVDNIEVTLTVDRNMSQVTSTDFYGYYEFPTLSPGVYIVTPIKYNWSFEPPSRQVYVLDQGIDNVDFIGTYTAEEPQEIAVPIGDDGTNINIKMPEPDEPKVILPEKLKNRRGVINPDDDEEVAIVFKSKKKPEEFINEKFTLRVFNLVGELVYSKEKIVNNPDGTWMKWSPKELGLSSGIYIIHIKGPGVDVKKKVPILR